LANGQANHVSMVVPDLKVMIEGMLDHPMLTTKWTLVRSQILDVCQLLLSKGNISDLTFACDWGFPVDTTKSGEEVYCPDGIAQENHQQAKLWDHPHQVLLQDRRCIDQSKAFEGMQHC
jgi:hypothetical protein